MARTRLVFLASLALLLALGSTGCRHRVRARYAYYGVPVAPAPVVMPAPVCVEEIQVSAPPPQVIQIVAAPPPPPIILLVPPPPPPPPPVFAPAPAPASDPDGWFDD